MLWRLLQVRLGLPRAAAAAATTALPADITDAAVDARQRTSCDALNYTCRCHDDRNNLSLQQVAVTEKVVD